MNARTVALSLVVFLAALAFTVPAVGEPQANIIVNYADEILETPVSVDPGLLDSITIAGPRVVVEYANHLRRMDLVTVPGPLQTLLDQVAERVAVEYANEILGEDLQAVPGGLQVLLDQMSERVLAAYANEILREELQAVPGGLQVLLDQVAERVAFQYANASLAYSLSYPADLVNDTTPPQVDEIAVGYIEANGVLTITWTTDEFADSTVLYGTQSGSYTGTVSDPLYVKEHAVGLPDLTAGRTYYYRLRSTDLSGNTTTTPEGHFTASREPLFIYLPLAVRDGP